MCQTKYWILKYIEICDLPDWIHQAKNRERFQMFDAMLQCFHHTRYPIYRWILHVVEVCLLHKMHDVYDVFYSMECALCLKGYEFEQQNNNYMFRLYSVEQHSVLRVSIHDTKLWNSKVSIVGLTNIKHIYLFHTFYFGYLVTCDVWRVTFDVDNNHHPCHEIGFRKYILT